MRILRIATAVLLAHAAFGQQPAPASLEGMVVHRETNAPLGGTTVELRTDAGASVRVLADDDGKFVIPNVQPGRYRLLATRQGFVRGEYGQKGDSVPWQGVPVRVNSAAEASRWREGRPTAPVLAIGAGQQLTGLRLVMTPGGAITGRVMDRGKPVRGLLVSAVKISYEHDGQPVLSKVLSATTNDLGEYHIFWLPPGRYYVMGDLSDFERIPLPVMFINPSDGLENPLLTRGTGQAEMARAFLPGESSQILFLRSGSISDSEMRVPIYFPNKADWRDATAIDITPGAEARNIDIEAITVPALHVRGAVTGAPTTAQGQPIRPQIALFEAAEPSITAYASVLPDANGSFDISRVKPGKYLLRANAGNTQVTSRVEVRDRDVTGLNLVLTTGVAVSGQISLERETPVNPDPAMAALSLILYTDRADLFGSAVIRPGANGVFTVPDVPVGDYRVSVGPLLFSPSRARRQTADQIRQSALDRVQRGLENAYVKSIKVGNVDVLNDGLHLTGPLGATLGASQMRVVVGMDGGTIDGRVVNESKQPARGATVALIPQSGLRFHVSHDVTSTDDSGKFQIKGVAPGDYKLFAWEIVETGAWQNADFVQKYEAQAQSVHIETGTRTAVEVLVVR